MLIYIITNYVSLGVIFRFLLNLRRLKVLTLWVVKSLEKPKYTKIPRKTVVLYLIYTCIYKYVCTCIRIFLYFFHSDIMVLLDWSNTIEIVSDTASEKNPKNIFKQNFFSEMYFVKKLKQQHQKQSLQFKCKWNIKSLRQLSRLDYVHLPSRFFQNRSKFFF